MGDPATGRPFVVPGIPAVSRRVSRLYSSLLPSLFRMHPSRRGSGLPGWNLTGRERWTGAVGRGGPGFLVRITLNHRARLLPVGHRAQSIANEAAVLNERWAAATSTAPRQGSGRDLQVCRDLVGREIGIQARRRGDGERSVQCRENRPVFHGNGLAHAGDFDRLQRPFAIRPPWLWDTQHPRRSKPVGGNTL